MDKSEKSTNLWLWNKQKIKVSLAMASPRISEGELWWSAFGENVGVEMAGKSKRFARPVLVFKKLSSNSFLAIPITTKYKKGSWYVSFSHKGELRTAVLSQIRVLSIYRLYDRMGTIDDEDFYKIKSGFTKLYA